MIKQTATGYRSYTERSEISEIRNFAQEIRQKAAESGGLDSKRDWNAKQFGELDAAQHTTISAKVHRRVTTKQDSNRSQAISISICESAVYLASGKQAAMERSTIHIQWPKCRPILWHKHAG